MDKSAQIRSLVESFDTYAGTGGWGGRPEGRGGGMRGRAGEG